MKSVTGVWCGGEKMWHKSSLLGPYFVPVYFQLSLNMTTYWHTRQLRNKITLES